MSAKEKVTECDHRGAMHTTNCAVTRSVSSHKKPR